MATKCRSGHTLEETLSKIEDDAREEERRIVWDAHVRAKNEIDEIKSRQDRATMLFGLHDRLYEGDRPFPFRKANLYAYELSIYCEEEDLVDLAKIIGCGFDVHYKDVADADSNTVEVTLVPRDEQLKGCVHVYYKTVLPDDAKCKIVTKTTTYSTLVCEID